MQPSNSPKGFSLVDAPRRGELYGQVSMAESVVLSHGPPASSTVTLTPARVSTYAAIPPPAPEPTMTTSAGELCVARRIQGSLVAECTAGVAWIGPPAPAAGSLLYRRNNPAAAVSLFHLMPHRLERPHRDVAQTATLVIGLVGQRLVVNPRRGDGVGETHVLVEHIQNHLCNAGDDSGTARCADDHLQIAGGVEQDRKSVV